jgi:hypothetical protein
VTRPRAAPLFAVVVMTTAAAEARAHGERCTSVNGDDTCPQGEACSVQDGGEGTCSSPPCRDDGECAPPLPFCNRSRTPAVCIQCRSDAECVAPRRRCELDPRSHLSNLCVECTLGGDRDCASADAGARCLVARGSCGCTTNDDCRRGRTCNAAGACETGGGGGADAADDAARASDDASPDVTAGRTVDARGSGCAAAPVDAAGPLVAALVAAVVALARAARCAVDRACSRGGVRARHASRDRDRAR